MKGYKNYLLTFVLLFLGVSSASADVIIPRQFRIKNRPPGYCAWCCLETLGRYHRIESLNDLAKNREKDPDHVIWIDPYQAIVFPKNVGTPFIVQQKLDSLNVKYRTIVSNDSVWLKEVTRKKGCMAFFRPGAFVTPTGRTLDGHAVILTEYNDKDVEFLDPNDCTYWKAERLWFDLYWDRYALVLESK